MLHRKGRDYKRGEKKFKGSVTFRVPFSSAVGHHLFWVFLFFEPFSVWRPSSSVAVVSSSSSTALFFPSTFEEDNVGAVPLVSACVLRAV